MQNSLIAGGCEIEGEVDFSVLFSDVIVEKGATVRDSIIMPGTVVRSGAVVQYAIVAENAVIEEGAVVGERPEAMQNLDDWGVAVVGEHITVGRDAVVAPKAMVDTDVSAVR